MKKLLLVIDMQNDFVSGALGSLEAQAIVPKVQAKIAAYQAAGHSIVFTRDTHQANYLATQEGQYLPVPHCIVGTTGHAVIAELNTADSLVFDKGSFGSLTLAEKIAEYAFDELELCGLCTDICVVSNALILKAKFPEKPVSVDASCCAGVSVASHHAALLTMQMCQVNVVNNVNKEDPSHV